MRTRAQTGLGDAKRALLGLVPCMPLTQYFGVFIRWRISKLAVAGMYYGYA